MVANAALGGTSVKIVLDAIARKQLDGPVVHVNGKVHREDALHLAQDGPDSRVEVEELGGDIELPLCCREWVRTQLYSNVPNVYGLQAFTTPFRPLWPLLSTHDPQQVPCHRA
jgi:hypothetical protein